MFAVEYLLLLRAWASRHLHEPQANLMLLLTRDNRSQVLQPLAITTL